MDTRRLDLGFYVSLLAASLALDLLLFGNLGAISEEAGGAWMTLMSAMLIPLLVLWLLATGLLVTAAAQKRWRAVGRGRVVFLLTGLSAVVLQVIRDPELGGDGGGDARGGARAHRRLDGTGCDGPAAGGHTGGGLHVKPSPGEDAQGSDQRGVHA